MTDLLIERHAPHPDSIVRAHRVVDAPPALAYRAVREIDFLDTGRDPIVRALFALRTLPARVLGKPPAPPPEAMTLAGLGGAGEFVLLDEDPGREIVGGMVGRFWGAHVAWELITSAGWDAFDRPGFAKIAFGFTVLPYGTGQSLVTYETRTTATDPESRGRVRDYLMVAGPFIRLVLIRHLQGVARLAEAQAEPAGRR